jgi:hypothetical protein
MHDHRNLRQMFAIVSTARPRDPARPHRQSRSFKGSEGSVADMKPKSGVWRMTGGRCRSADGASGAGAVRGRRRRD